MNIGRMLVENNVIFAAKEVTVIIRNDNKPIKIGDTYGCAKVIRLQAYGKDLQEIGEGLTAAVTFDRMPLFSIVEDGNFEQNITKEMASNIIIALSVAEHESQINIDSAREIVAEIVKIYPELREMWVYD